MKKSLRALSALPVLLAALLAVAAALPCRATNAENAVQWFEAPGRDFADVEYFERNVYVFTDASGKKGLIDNAGNILVYPSYERFERCTCGNILVDGSGSAIGLDVYGYLSTGSVTERPHDVYTGFYGCADDGALYALAKADALTALPYTDAAAVVFERVHLQTDPQTGAILEDGLHTGDFGIYTADGRTVGSYAAAVDFQNGVCAVFNGSKWAYADESGALLTDFVYDATKTSTHLTDTAAVYTATDGVIPVCRDGLWGYLDLSGKETVPLLFEKTTPAADGKAWVRANGVWGIADLSNIPVIAQSASIGDTVEGVAAPGQTLRLSAAVYPSRAKVTWRSDNEAVARVEASGDGSVDCLAEGESVIRVFNELGQELAAYPLTVRVPETGEQRHNPKGLIVTVLAVCAAACAAVGTALVVQSKKKA